MIIVVDLKLPGDQALFVALLLSLFFFSVVFGNIIGILLNWAKGKEMIASIVIGFFLGTNLYQLVFFMVGYGTLITPFSDDILLTRGIGVKSMLDCMHFKSVFVENSLLGIGGRIVI